MTTEILQQGYSYSPYNDEIIAVEPAVGMVYAQRRTNGEPFVFNVTWQTDDRDGFEAWAESVAETGYTESLQIEAGAPVDVSVVFTERGYPQMQSSQNGTYTFRGRLFANSLPNPDAGLYDTLLFGAQNDSTGDNDPENYFSLLDFLTNEPAA